MDIFNERSDLDLSINFSDSIEINRMKKIQVLRKFSKKLRSIQSKLIILSAFIVSFCQRKSSSISITYSWILSINNILFYVCMTGSVIFQEYDLIALCHPSLLLIIIMVLLPNLNFLSCLCINLYTSENCSCHTLIELWQGHYALFYIFGILKKCQNSFLCMRLNYLREK